MDISIVLLAFLVFVTISVVETQLNFQVEPPVSPFYGRADILFRLQEISNEITDSKWTFKDSQLNDHNTPINNDFPSSSILILKGSSGIGKTQLVRQYLKLNRKKYKNVISLEASSVGKLQNSISRLAHHPQIRLNDSSTSVAKISKRIYRKLFLEKTILIFDNVQLDASIEKSKRINWTEYLPSKSTTHLKNPPFILFTSQSTNVTLMKNYPEFRRARVIQIPRLSKEESIRFILNGLEIQSELEPQKNLMELIEFLEGSPQAIGMAVQFIRMTSSGQSYNLEGYLKLMRHVQKTFNFPKNEPFRLTYQVALEILGETNEGKLATELLLGCPLYPQGKIKEKFLRQLFAQPQDWTSEAIVMLNNFGLVEILGDQSKNKEIVLNFPRSIQIASLKYFQISGNLQVAVGFFILRVHHFVKTKVEQLTIENLNFMIQMMYEVGHLGQLLNDGEFQLAFVVKMETRKLRRKLKSMLKVLEEMKMKREGNSNLQKIVQSQEPKENSQQALKFFSEKHEL